MLREWEWVCAWEATHGRFKCTSHQNRNVNITLYSTETQTSIVCKWQNSTRGMFISMYAIVSVQLSHTVTQSTHIHTTACTEPKCKHINHQTLKVDVVHFGVSVSIESSIVCRKIIHIFCVKPKSAFVSTRFCILVICWNGRWRSAGRR